MSNNPLYIGLKGLAGSGKDTVAKMIRVILGHKDLDLEACKAIYKEHYYDPWISATHSEITDDSDNVFCIAFADQLKTICSTIFGIPIKRFYQNKSTAWVCINKDFQYTEVKPDDSQIMTADEYYAISGFQGDYQNSKIWMSLRELLVYVGTYVLQQDINKKIFVNVVHNLIKEQIISNKKLEYVIITDIRFSHEIEYVRSHNGLTINILRDSVQQLDNIAEHDLDHEQDWDYTIANNGTYDDLFENVYHMIHDDIEFKNITYDLSTRENVANYIRQITDEEGHDKYMLCSDYEVASTAHTDGKITMIDPVGGPTIYVGHPVDINISGIRIVPHEIFLDDHSNKFILCCDTTYEE